MRDAKEGKRGGQETRKLTHASQLAKFDEHGVGQVPTGRWEAKGSEKSFNRIQGAGRAWQEKEVGHPGTESYPSVWEKRRAGS